MSKRWRWLVAVGLVTVVVVLLGAGWLARSGNTVSAQDIFGITDTDWETFIAVADRLDAIAWQPRTRDCHFTLFSDRHQHTLPAMFRLNECTGETWMLTDAGGLQWLPVSE